MRWPRQGQPGKLILMCRVGTNAPELLAVTGTQGDKGRGARLGGEAEPGEGAPEVILQVTV